MSKLGPLFVTALALVACGRVKDGGSGDAAGTGASGSGNVAASSGAAGSSEAGAGGSGGGRASTGAGASAGGRASGGATAGGAVSGASATGGAPDDATGGQATSGEAGAAVVENGGGEGGGAELGPPCDGSRDYLRCDGNRVAHCVCAKQGPVVGTDLTGGPIYACEDYAWVDDEVCSVACDTAINGSMGCVASEEPIPECAEDGFACLNGEQIFCNGGYGLSPTPCEQGTVCTLVDGCQALCLSPSAAVDARCPPGPGINNDVCKDNVAYHCSCGYLTGTSACGDGPNECVTVSAFDGQYSGPYALCGLPP